MSRELDILEQLKLETEVKYQELQLRLATIIVEKLEALAIHDIVQQDVCDVLIAMRT